MKTLTVDIINDKALDLLKDLEALKLIRVRKNISDTKSHTVDWSKRKGTMKKQSTEEIDLQLSELRNGWE
jgi:hypothetical protein